MKVTIASGSIASIPLIQSLMASDQFDRLLIPEPFGPLRQVFGTIVPHDRILETTRESAQKIRLSPNSDRLISIGYTYKIGFDGDGSGVNVHFGALPENKGPDPLFWTLKEGKKIAYITIHEISEQIDSGDILLQKGHPIMPGENYGLLYSRLGALLVPMIQEILNSTPSAQAQDVSESGYYKKPTEDDCRIDWRQSSQQIEALINACNPRYNGAMTTLNGGMIRILEVNPIPNGAIPNTESAVPGKVVLANQDGIFVKCGEGILKLNVVSLNEGLFSGQKLVALGVNQTIQLV